jgi:hypothetical protein
VKPDRKDLAGVNQKRVGLASVVAYLKRFLREPFSVRKVTAKERKTGGEIAREPAKARLVQLVGYFTSTLRGSVGLLQGCALETHVKLRTGCEELQRRIVGNSRLLE